MAVVRKKQDDKYLKVLRELVSMNGNKQCFDCNQKGPTYVNMTIGSFVCTRCSGILRGLTPPHRVKSISMAVFSTEEIDFIKAHGNDLCAKTWLALWDPKRNHKHDHRELMIEKYERKRYYLEPASPLKSITNTAQLSQSQKQQMNGVAATTNGVNKSIEENSFNSLWSTNEISNGINSAPIALTNGSRTQNSYNNKLDLFSSNDNNSLFNGSNNNNNSHLTQQTNGISLNNGINLSASSDNGLSNGFHGIGSNDKQRHQQQQQQQQNVINKNGLNLQQMSPSSSSLSSAASNLDNSSNLFTPDSDFVADFGSANIFNAMNNKPANTNGYPMKPIHLNGPTTTNGNHANGFDKMTNGKRSNGNSSNGTTNGFDDIENDNFADFEHNTIYNAAAIENQNNNCYYNSNNNASNNYVNVSSFGYSNSNTFTYSNNANANGNANANAQWSVWQQFPWPYIQSEQNRWSLPMSVSSTSNSLKSSGTFNSNSSINSTPSIDRYAALKDLDEQLREMKEKDIHNTQTATNPVTANPFNVSNGQPATAVQPNPFQSTGNHQMLWPSDQTTNLFGNGLNGSQQSMYPFNNGNNIFNGNGNGNANPYQTKLAGHNAFNGSITIPNGFPQQQHKQQPNPFAAPVLNATTNPFL